MWVTFFVGNGFDIGLNLKTRYEDFYDKYCILADDDSEVIKNFKHMLEDRHKEKFIDGVKQKKIIDWADFEKAFGEYSEFFTLDTKQDYIECFEHFVSSFNTYIEKEESKIDLSDKKYIADTMRKAVDEFYNIRQADKNNIQKTINSLNSFKTFSFVSFNYTKILDNCVKILAEQCKNESGIKIGTVSHIHGYIAKNMIMGVNDTSQIINREFAEDTDILYEIVKPLQNEDARTDYESPVIGKINNSDIICIYGMSLGETDRKWWETIIKWLAGNKNRILIILSHEKDYNERFTYNQRKIVLSIENKFLSYLPECEIDKESIRKRIYVGINNDIFSMKLANTDVLDEFNRIEKNLNKI